MTFVKAYPLSSEEHAVLGQPVYLLVVLIIAAAIISLLGLSLQNIIGDAQIHQVECQIDTILTESSNMFEYADEGSRAIMHVEFPTSLRFIVFGSLPRNGTLEPTNLTLDENTSNNYYFVMNDGNLRLSHSNARFSNRNLTQIAVFHPGCYNLTLELIINEGKTYVTLY
jgi:type II secretory pathway pseudopilin PulG